MKNEGVAKPSFSAISETGICVWCSKTLASRTRARSIHCSTVSPLKRRYDTIGMCMQYCRYYAKGGVRFTPAGGQTREAHGDMIYEYAYMGMPDPSAHV